MNIIRVKRILRRIEMMLNGSYERGIEENRQKAHEVSAALVHDYGQTIQGLEALVHDYGQTIQELQRDIADFQEPNKENKSAPNPTGHALEMNSYYVDKFPHDVADFEDWDEDNVQRLYETIKDREWHHFYDTAMGLLVCSHEGDYYEFGCCGGGSMRIALAKSLKWHLNDMDFYAFDSFEGFPTTGALKMTEQDFMFSIKGDGIKVDRVTTIPGFYDKSLTKKLQEEFLAKPLERRPKLINVDCDLHDSAVPVFEFIEPLVQPGTIIMLDDFWGTFDHGKQFGTALAFNEYCEKYPRMKFYPFMRIGCWGMSFIAYDPKVFTAPVV